MLMKATVSRKGTVIIRSLGRWDWDSGVIKYSLEPITKLNHRENKIYVTSLLRFYVSQGYLKRFTVHTTQTFMVVLLGWKLQYLSRSHYPREHKWGTSFRALSQLHKWSVKSSFVCGIDHIKQTHNCYWYSHCRSIYCSNQWLREVYEVCHKFPVMKAMYNKQP